MSELPKDIALTRSPGSVPTEEMGTRAWLRGALPSNTTCPERVQPRVVWIITPPTSLPATPTRAKPSSRCWELEYGLMAISTYSPGGTFAMLKVPSRVADAFRFWATDDPP